MKRLVAQAGLEKQIEIESAGTGSYHVGEPADRRSAATARERGVVLDGRAKQFGIGDFDRFDYVVAMDSRNFGFLKRLARGPGDTTKLALLRSYDEVSVASKQDDVPDPYFEDNFDLVFDICEAGCKGLLAQIVERHKLA